ncbi:tRNA1(Val) (adenine(37)-N6)-methyltransferase [Cohnella faecalis]|uniref:tRNA1(Val) (Adenine(37)-N6)-methyltransferase n=1 Tax=Cohnella faecalis TaxID=2315694 RepID=A0A398CPJ4_9BACL|nr:tRNA1(Val) (adenine(37)-N6)-methyltransferase [Cohnella faecalis]RIE01411.1 tRNA1(Val) (adenine(37)-N6)-methyltransferase [Cohnella faecalis]
MAETANTDAILQPGERLDDLLSYDMRIIQSSEVFSFSLDAVLLARFAALPPRGRILDLCTGNGVIPLLLTTRTSACVDAVEIQPRLADMARRSIRLNGLEERISVIEDDLRAWTPPNGEYDAVTVNPPYMPLQSGDRKENIHQAMARHEIGCTLEDVVAACARCVKTGGRVSMVHRPSRLVEITEAMRRHRLEPKRMRFVHPRSDAEANMVLIDALKGGRPEVRLLPPIIVYKGDGRTYTEELLDIFYGRRTELADSTGKQEEQR